MIKLEDDNRDPAELDTEVANMFRQHYLASLSGSPPFVRLESGDFVNQLYVLWLIVVLQECTTMANSVPTLLKRLPMHSRAAFLPLCS
jgi:hypothetical protein